MLTTIRSAFLIICSFFVFQANAQQFLDPEKAFPVQVAWTHAQELTLKFQPELGYYIYRDSLKLKSQGQVIDLKLPKGLVKFDENFDKHLETYPKPFTATAWLPGQLSEGRTGPLILILEIQGCADKGICYPPMELEFRLSAPGAEVLGRINEEPIEKQHSWKDIWDARDDVMALVDILRNISPWVLLIAFFILGIAMSLTPCVLPMLPILSAVIFGGAQSQTISKFRAFSLAMAYVLGMALMYSIAGMLTAALGSGLQAWFQHPVVLIAFALLLCALAASLFGFYELRLPVSWMNQVDRLAGRQKGGSVVGALTLGAISTLIASPCVTAPLAGVLTFVAQTGSVPLGGVMLFVMALGMGLPLVLLAIGAKSLLPKAGAWMVGVQRVFGVIMLALAVWVALPVFTSAPTQQEIHRLSSGLEFKRVHSQMELDQQLAQAKSNGQKVLLDFYADWCISCKEMEALTFSDEKVIAALKTYQLIQVDVTKNSAEHQKILKRYQLFGPPAILFFNEQGAEMTQARVIGFMKAERFTERLNSLKN